MKRTKARRIALQILYTFDFKKDFSYTNFDTLFQTINRDKDTIINTYAEKLIFGVSKQRNKLDRIISRYSKHWRLSRMSIVDRNILRIGVFESIFCNDVPHKVIIDEAVELGKLFGDTNSSSFINGILDSLIKNIEKERLEETKDKRQKLGNT